MAILREVESFGAPVIDQAANRGDVEEQVDLMLKCFNDDSFNHHGKRYEAPPPVEYRGYQLSDITCVPRPKHLPVEVWMPIASSKSIDYMASKNFKAMVTLNGEKILDDVVGLSRRLRQGPDEAARRDMTGAPGLISPTRELSAGSSRRTTSATVAAPFGFVRYADEQGRTWGTPSACPPVARRRNPAEGVVLRSAVAR